MHIMAYVGEEFSFHSFWLYIVANLIFVQTLIMYIVTCPHWYFVLYPHTSSIEGRMLTEDLADQIFDGKTVVLKSILKDEGLSFWTEFHWRKVHCWYKWPDK